MLELIPAERLVALGMKIRVETLPSIEDHIVELAANADLDEDPESHFELMVNSLHSLEFLGPDERAHDLISAARVKMDEEIKKLIVRKAEREAEKEDESDWTAISVVSDKDDVGPVETEAQPARSIFDDVDQ